MIKILLFSPFFLGLLGCSHTNWREASRESAGIAPDPKDIKGAIFQIYVARAYSWRGYFGLHPWIAWKRPGEDQYTISQVIGWRARQNLNTIIVHRDLPDRYWFGSRPEMIFSVEGEVAEKIINQLPSLIENYPYKMDYRIWPGPNSNTYIDYIIRNIPELTVELPPHSIGKDYLVDSWFFAKSPSGKGGQISLFGIFGLTIGLAEGLELNLLGLTLGIDFMSPALKLPMIGRLGMKDRSL